MQETKPLFPLHCTFKPSDEQLVQHYLFKKNSRIADPFLSCCVRDEDLYGIKEPWEIWNQFGGPKLADGEDLYFFTHLKKKKSANGSRIDRKVGSGVWQGDDGGKVIKSCNSEQKIGSKKMFRYENEGSPHNGCWIMHEYTLNASLLPHNLQSSDCVLCRISKNGQPVAVWKTNSRKKRMVDEQYEDMQQPEPVLVENHQYQDVQEKPQPFTEQTPHDQLQFFQNHLLMQQTPSYFFRAQEENHQLSTTEQNLQDLQLSEYHQKVQLAPVTDQNSHEQLQPSVENHQLYTSSGLKEYQQMPPTEQSPCDQLEQLNI